MFFFRKSKLVLDCFTTNAAVYDYAPIQPAIKFIPEWWKNLPKTYPTKGNLIDHSTMKYCSGFINQFQNGIIIPMWSELLIEVGPINDKNKFRWIFSNQVSTVSQHPEQQRGTYLPDTHYQHIKISSPWQFKCNKDIKWQFIMNPYVFDKMDNYLVLPGITDYKYQSSTNINIMFKRTTKYEKYMFNYGQPMVQIIPLSDQSVEIKNHLIGVEEQNRMFNNRMFFHNVHNKFIKVKDKIDAGKCPFNRG